MPFKPPGRPQSKSRTAFQHLQDQLKYVDLIVEVLDARAPFSSRHPRSQEIFGSKPRVVIITKEDLADPQRTSAWVNFFEAEGRQAKAVSLSLKEQQGKGKIFNLILLLTKEKRAAHVAKGLLPRPVRICVVGMPNVGKSSLINWLIGQKRAKVGNKPGITRGAQWVRVHEDIELLDTPGILPAFNFAKVMSDKLAVINLLPEANYDIEEIAQGALDQMETDYPRMIQAYIPHEVGALTLEDIARKRNFIATGGHPDRVRAANIFISDLRHGKIGRFTLDVPKPVV